MKGSLKLFPFILLAVIICNATDLAQENPSTPEFPIGTYFHDPAQLAQDYFDSSGMNTIVWKTDDNSHQFLSNYNLIAYNPNSQNDWICYYSASYYSKWEAEEQTGSSRIGIKHKHGQEAQWEGIDCWSTKGISSPVDSLVHGPHYRQEKQYAIDARGYGNAVQYIPRFRMALVYNPENVSGDEPVCKIKVVIRHTRYIDNVPNEVRDDVLSDKILTVSAFNDDSTFKDIYFGSPPNDVYQYPSNYFDGLYPNIVHDLPMTGVTYRDTAAGQGVEFWVEWLRDDTLCTLYIDNIEVYDNNGWSRMVGDSLTAVVAIQNIKNYAQTYNSNWPNIQYWYGKDEPRSLDCYIPMRKVDSLVNSKVNKKVVNAVWPEYNVTVNGDSQLVNYYRRVNPEHLMIDFYPFTAAYNPIRPGKLDDVRKQFQLASSIQSGFWYVAQSYGFMDSSGTWYGARRPGSSELKAVVMLALAHGSKGILFWPYDSYIDTVEGVAGHLACIVGLPDSNYAKSDLWYLIHNNLAPRLTGKLGDRLLGLDYTGDYISKSHFPGEAPINQTTLHYLTIPYGLSSDSVNWHAGFFDRNGYDDDKYFFLVNLLPESEDSVGIRLAPPVAGYYNYRFRNFEGQFDTTFFADSNLTYVLNHPAGEGYLYEVAPVIKYGGRLLYNELTGDGITLSDDMIIDNGAVLSVYEDYYAEGNIIIKNGSIINQEGGIIHFRNGKKLIIEGNASIHGNSQDKLTFDFITPGDSNGVIINSGGSLDMAYCLIKNAATGINAETNYNASSGTLNIQYMDFENCSNSCITIQGQAAGYQMPSVPPTAIKYCTMNLSDYGIWASNLAQVLIRENHITNTDMGIFLSDISTAQVIGNVIQSSTYQLPGIFLESSNGLVRSNVIQGHTHGIQLGNSSPDIGGNIIEDNLNRGLYVGSGSLPDMQGRLASDPEHPNLWYAVSGYNKIRNNGGSSPDDDGSEIFINNADVIMKGGCNEITDQRIPNTNGSSPLYNTRLLMNCGGSAQPPEVHAELNFWDVHPLYRLEERFGDCIVYFDPATDPCPLPLEGENRLLITTSSGEVVDTLYAEQRTVGTSPTETAYAEAEEKFLTADYQSAENIYNGIINSEDSVNAKLFAYRRLFETGKLLRKDENYFSDLRDSYLSLAGAMNDSLQRRVFNHLSILSLVAREDYIPAIGEFDEIIQQNPNTEEAVFAEIDAVTTAILLEGGDTTLNKSRLGKYLIKPGGNYFARMDEIIRKNFGSGMEAESEKMLPTEYSLYNNYPNPFNPSTTIRFDIPERANVELIVYDILGRKVKSLISNEIRNPGRYEVSFNASSLASGVYIYKLTTKNYSQVRKMLLIK